MKQKNTLIQIISIVVTIGLIFFLLPKVNTYYFAPCGGSENGIKWQIIFSLILGITLGLVLFINNLLRKKKKISTSSLSLYMHSFFSVLIITALFPWINELLYVESCGRDVFLPAIIFNCPLLALAACLLATAFSKQHAKLK